MAPSLWKSLQNPAHTFSSPSLPLRSPSAQLNFPRLKTGADCIADACFAPLFPFSSPFFHRPIEMGDTGLFGCCSLAFPELIRSGCYQWSNPLPSTPCRLRVQKSSGWLLLIERVVCPISWSSSSSSTPPVPLPSSAPLQSNYTESRRRLPRLIRVQSGPYHLPLRLLLHSISPKPRLYHPSPIFISSFRANWSNYSALLTTSSCFSLSFSKYAS